MRSTRLLMPVVVSMLLVGCTDEPTAPFGEASEQILDAQLANVLAEHDFTGMMGFALGSRLTRSVDQPLAVAGRLLFFDPILALKQDNSCAGCHSPTAGFADAQSIAIGIDNNGIVGPNRKGPRNQRRSPTLLNAAFLRTQMWNSRFRANSNDPFDNRSGFSFPDPDSTSLSALPHLLTAQAFIPVTERVEMTGFDFPGDAVEIRTEVVRRVNGNSGYRALFASHYQDVRDGGPIQYQHIARAIGEFTFALTRANAPIDRFARGDRSAMTTEQKRGAVLFFGRAGCVGCHAVGGASNEMFSDFEEHNIGVPQIVPSVTNVTFDGPGANEDFGLGQFTGELADRYWFRTSPLRNLAVQPTFMHNGAFVTLESAIRHHLDVAGSVSRFTTDHLASDLRNPLAPMQGVLATLDPLVAKPMHLTEQEIAWLVAFVGDGLLDPEARPERLRSLVPTGLPSGLPVHDFEFSP